MFRGGKLLLNCFLLMKEGEEEKKKKNVKLERPEKQTDN
jgi:hypothetical protein